MFGFGHGQDTKARAELLELRAELSQLRREVTDLDLTVQRWMRRDRERERREMVTEGPAGASAPVPRMGLAAPPNLTGARLRIWRRRHQLEPEPAPNGAEE